MMKESESITQLIMGDPSGDGHGQHTVIHVRFNKPISAVESAYEKGTKLIRFDLVEHVCSEYEDNKIDDEIIAALQAAGFNISEDEADFVLQETFLKMYQFILNLGDPELSCETVKLPELYIGGYGLFL